MDTPFPAASAQLTLKHKSGDPYSVHRAVLRPLVQREMPANWQLPDEISAAQVAVFLYRQKLHALWNELVQHHPGSPELKDLLAAATRMSVAIELPGQRTLQDAHNNLEQAGIQYFIAKGAHLQHSIYERPMLRPASDIDVFVHSRDRKAATDCLVASGFTAEPIAETLSHELKLVKQNVAIDLHWHLLRPGRYRPGLMDWLFGRREKFGNFWGLDATASLLVMLAHPAITKYLISPTSMLIHQVDQLRLIQSGKVDWTVLFNALDQYGLKTAAWSSLYLLGKLTEVVTPEQMEQRLRPKALHSYWLRQWIDRAWITRWFERRRLVAGLFNLALQDSLADAVTALKMKKAALNS